MQNIIDKQEQKIHATKSRITVTRNLLHHINPKNHSKIEYLQYRLQAEQVRLHHEQTELEQLRKRLAKLPALQRQVRNTAHHNLAKAERERSRYLQKQIKRRERYLQTKLNDTT